MHLRIKDRGAQHKASPLPGLTRAAGCAGKSTWQGEVCGPLQRRVVFSKNECSTAHGRTDQRVEMTAQRGANGAAKRRSQQRGQ
jgi:hypothetical protein